MKVISSRLLKLLHQDAEPRELAVRQIVTERLALGPPPKLDDAVVATYFFAFRTSKLKDAVEEISYHATIGVRNPPPGSLLAACAARPVGVDAFDRTERLGLLHVAFPLRMILQPDGHATSCDLLHTVAGAIIFDVYENQDAKLVALQLPPRLL